MVSAGDFRNGVTLEIDGQVVQIVEFQKIQADVEKYLER